MNKQTTFNYALAVILYLLAPAALAIGLFQPAPLDISLQYMGDIFQMPAVGITGDQSPDWFNKLFEKFNWLIFTAGIVIVSYVGILSIINTAQEGEIMGKAYSSVWIPLRSAIGLLVLHPSSGSGYSLIQHTIMWIVIQGVGAADTLWNVVVDNFDNPIGPPLFLGEMLVQHQAKILSRSLLNAAICIEATGVYPQGNQRLEASHHDFAPSVQNQSYGMSTSIIFGLKDDPQYSNLCGEYTITTTFTEASVKKVTGITNITPEILKDLTEESHAQKVLAVDLMFGKFLDLAKTITSETIGPRDTTLPSVMTKGVSNGKGRLKIGGTSGDDSGVIEASEKAFIDTITAKHYAKCQSFYDLELPVYCSTSSSDQIKANARGRGWLSAAQFYKTLTRAVAKEIWPANLVPTEMTKPTQSWHFGKYTAPGNQTPYFDYHDMDKIQAANPDQDVHDVIKKSFTDNANLLEYYGGPGGNFESFINVIYLLNDGYAYATKARTGYKLMPVNDDTGQAVNDSANPLRDALIDLRTRMAEALITDSKDAIVSVTHFGTHLMESGETVFWITLATVLVLAGVSGVIIPLIVPFAGIGPIYHFAPIVQALIPMLTALLFSIATFLWVMGSMLAVYVPLIPYTIFAMAGMGWFILVIEAIVCAPVFALALVLPAQDELGKLTNGIQILAGIFLRPMFMILGFLCSILLIRAMIGFIKESIFVVMDSSLEGGGGSFAPLAQLLVFEGLVITVITQGFQLIHILPDNVMRWVGGTTESGAKGADAALGAAKGGVEKGAGMAKSAMEGAGDAGSKLQGAGLDNMSAAMTKNKKEHAEAKEKASDKDESGYSKDESTDSYRQGQLLQQAIAKKEAKAAKAEKKKSK